MHPWRTVGQAIPRSGCAPAEPASVSPGARRVTLGQDGSKVRMDLVLCLSSRKEKGVAAVNGEARQGREVASGVPRLTVILVKVRVP